MLDQIEFFKGALHMTDVRGIAVRSALAVLALGTASVAEAAPIAVGSTLNFAGQSTCNATTCTFGNAIVTSGTGSFSSFMFGTVATFFPLTYSPFTAQQIYTTTNAAGQTASFATMSQLSQSTTVVGGLTNYTITDWGTARLTGFDDTLGTYLFTANQNGTVMGSFSATVAASAAPEPGTWSLMILGVGAAGYALRRRRRVAMRVSCAG